MNRILDRADIVTLGKKTMEDLIVHPPKDATSVVIRMTSGTTGSDPVVIVNEQDAAARLMRDAQRIVICMGTLNSRLANALFVRTDQEHAARVLAIDAADLTPEVADLLADFAPDALWGFFSFIVRVGECLHRSTGETITSLRIGGELTTPSLERALAERFPHASIAFVYNANEIGAVAQPRCQYQPRNRYHPAEGVTIEIHEPDEKGVGDILISKVFYRDWSVERYRIGDLGRMIAGVCACGAETTFEVCGRRGHDYVKLAGAVLRREEFDRVQALLGAFDDYRVEASNVFEGGLLKGKVFMRVRLRDGVGTQALARELAEKISQEVFVTRTRSLAQLTKEGVLLPLVVEFAEEAFSQKYKDIKLVQKSPDQSNCGDATISSHNKS